MTDYRRKTAIVLTKITRSIVESIAGAAFEFWQRNDFRFFVTFNTIGQTEQDRIFNELEVSVLGLYVLHFENIAEFSVPEIQSILRAIARDLPDAFLDLLNVSGVEQMHIRTWKKLIAMRLREYRRDMRLARKHIMKWPEINSEPLQTQRAVILIQTIAIDCLSHIRRGVIEENDPLFRLLRQWLTMHEGQISTLNTQFNSSYKLMSHHACTEVIVASKPVDDAVVSDIKCQHIVSQCYVDFASLCYYVL